MLRYLIVALNFSVPEFADFPIYMQNLIASFARYEEFEPGRVIVRQGHYAENFYMIISGNANVIEASQSGHGDEVDLHPISYLKRGDSFGDLAIINNVRRTATVTVHGTRLLCLLAIDKEDFFLIQSPVSNQAQKEQFLRNKVPLLSLLNYPIAELLNEKKACFPIFYRTGNTI
jgi:CRP-like cAMP-binding protein